MRIESLATLIDGSVQNKPFIHSVENFVFDVNKVKRGDLYVANAIDTIPAAIAAGAYAILYDKNVQIIDQEIAWIKVASLEDSIAKLLKFELMNHDLEVYYCNSIMVDLLDNINHNKRIKTFKGNIVAEAESFLRLKKTKQIVISSDLMFLKKIFATINYLPETVYNSIELKEKTIFESSFIYQEVYYDKIKISPFMLSYLEKAFNFLDTKNIKYALKAHIDLKHFQVEYVNKNLQVQEFGQSEQALIFEPNLEFVEEITQYLNKELPWNNSIIIIPSHFKLNNSNARIYSYRYDKDIVEILKKESFTHAVIAEKTKSFLEEDIVQFKPTQLTLF